MNPRKFWNIIKNLFPTKSKANFATTTCNEAENIAKANTFCDYFSTIVKTLKSSVSLLNYYVWKTPHYIAQRTVKTFRMEYVSKLYIEKEMKSFKPKKGLGLDELPSFLKTVHISSANHYATSSIYH